MLEDDRVRNERHLRDAQPLFCGLIYFFKDNLLSPYKDCAVSLDFMLKNPLQLKIQDQMLLYGVKKLRLLSISSNSKAIVEKILQKILGILTIHGDSQRSLPRNLADSPVCAVTAPTVAKDD